MSSAPGSLLVLRKFILPLAAPGIAAVAVFQSVFVWNDYFAPLIVIQRPSLFTVQLAMGNFSVVRGPGSAAVIARDERRTIPHRGW
jgi:ABC-type glycerol-3-phosphate transport system permease component